MLTEQTIEKLTGMRLHGMAKSLRQWAESPRDVELRPEDLIGLLADAEWVHRENNKLTSRLRKAKFKQQACVEDIIYKSGRGVTKAVVNELASSRWVATHRNIILTGPTGVGKSFIACALGQKACRDGYAVLYKRTTRLFDELAQARADGTYALALRRIAKASVLILDDFGLQPLTAAERKDLLEVMEDRYSTGSTVVTSQLEPNLWHAVIGDETMADSICDRLVHRAHRLKLGGESIRKQLASEKDELLTAEGDRSK
jgi:DNA replication protein DnaC